MATSKMPKTPKTPNNPSASRASKPALGKTPASGDSTGTVHSSTGGAAAPGRDAAASTLPDDRSAARLAARRDATALLATAMPHNPLKAAEYGEAHAVQPQAGEPIEAVDTIAGSSTVQEDIASDKLGDGEPRIGHNATNEPLARVRVDSTGRHLTTNQGVAISDNQNSLKAGLRGPTLLEDFVLREKISHFDHERIPERVVHARGSAAHGYFESYEALTDLTMAAPFAEKGKRTPVFVRFSTVAGERGSADLARDVRGFAVKFYTDEGNWDLVGNNIPVFFVQDAMKFPDLVHAVKPEPHHGMPQAASAHDTFWDFAGLMPEITHMLMWVMSDRAIPRSYRTMQGFGVHTFRLINQAGESRFVKFHWIPEAGTHSVVWDEAVKINGADPDFHRRDLWEAIEGGIFPTYELALQVFTEEEADAFSFDVLDATKLVPEELVPLRTVGKLVLNRNPDNFFAETEQVAFCTQHVVPGIDFSNDPLLAGRHFSYLDTQITRLGGPNFHEIPINGSVAQAHNNQRDGLHRQAIHRGRVSYEPNSLAGGCPFQAGMSGFVSFPARVEPPETKLRGKPEKFADHFTQARLFWLSQQPHEQNHIVAAFRFELSKVQTPPVRERVVSMLRNVDETLAARVADGLGIALPEAQPRVLAQPAAPEIEVSHALSLTARPGDATVRGRKVALLVADGCDADSLCEAHAALAAAMAVPVFVGTRLGMVTPEDGEPIAVEMTFENAPSVLWDACVLPDGEAAQASLAANGQAIEFVRQQYRHAKSMLVLGSARTLLEIADVLPELADGSADPGIVLATGTEADDDLAPTGDVPAVDAGDAVDAVDAAELGNVDDDDEFAARPAATPARMPLDAAVAAFISALARHRHFERELDPPMV